MPFDIQGYKDKYKDFYGDSPLEDVAKDAYSRGYNQGEPDYDTWKKSAGIESHIQEDLKKRTPKTWEDKLRDAVASVTPAGFEDIPTSFVKGATFGYVPAVKTPEDAGIIHKMATGAAGLAGMGVGLIPAAALLPEAATVAGVAATGAALGGLYGAVRKPEEGESRLSNTWKDALMFGAFGVGGKVITKGLGAVMPETVGKLLEKIDANAKLPAAERVALTPVEEAIHSKLGYVTSGALMGGAGATEPAEDWKQRVQNIVTGIGVGVGAHGITSALHTAKGVVTKETKIDPETEDYLNKVKLGADSTAIIDEGLKTGKVGEEQFTPEHAIDIIKTGQKVGVFNDADIDSFRDKYPTLKQGLNDIVVDSAINKVNETLKISRPVTADLEQRNRNLASEEGQKLNKIIPKRNIETDVPLKLGEPVDEITKEPKKVSPEITNLQDNIAKRENYLAGNKAFEGTDMYKKNVAVLEEDKAKLAELTGTALKQPVSKEILTQDETLAKGKGNVSLEDNKPLAGTPETQAGVNKGTLLPPDLKSDNVFARMPEEQLRPLAEQKVQGAVDEFARRSGTTPEINPLASAKAKLEGQPNVKDAEIVQPGATSETEKQPWMVTKDEYLKEAQNRYGSSAEADAAVEKFHKDHVSSAIAAGEKVPPEVLKDYPDLQKAPPVESVKQNAGASEVTGGGEQKNTPTVDKELRMQLVNYKAELINKIAKLNKEKNAATTPREINRIDRLLTTTENEAERYLREKTLPQDRIDNINLTFGNKAQEGKGTPIHETEVGGVKVFKGDVRGNADIGFKPAEIFIRAAEKKDLDASTKSMSAIPDKEGYEKVYKPYGKEGRGFYYVKTEGKQEPASGKSIRTQLIDRIEQYARKLSKENVLAAVPIKKYKLTPTEQQELVKRGLSFEANRMGEPHVRISQVTKTNELRNTVKAKQEEKKNATPEPAQQVTQKKENPNKGAQNLVTFLIKAGKVRLGSTFTSHTSSAWDRAHGKKGKDVSLEYGVISEVSSKNGKMSMDEAASYLNAEGFPSRDGKPWTDVSLFEELSTGDPRNILHPEKAESIINRQIERQTNEYADEQEREIIERERAAQEGIDAEAIRYSQERLKDVSIEEIASEAELTESELAFASRDADEFIEKVTKTEPPKGDLAIPAESVKLSSVEEKPGTANKPAKEPPVAEAEYKGQHRPMTVEAGSGRLHDLEPTFGPDIYGPNAIQYFGTGEKVLDIQTLRILKSVKGKPEAEVTIYRAIPKDAPATVAAPGDWVTVNKKYAQEHGEGILGGDYKIIEQKVKAKDLTTNADSFHEQGYYPETTPKIGAALIKEARKYKSAEEFVQKTHAKFTRLQDNMSAADQKLADAFYKSDKEAIWNKANETTPEVGGQKLSSDEIKSKQSYISEVKAKEDILSNPETEISKPLSKQVTSKNADMFAEKPGEGKVNEAKVEGNLQDFGEKIGGARSSGDEWNQMDDSIKQTWKRRVDDELRRIETENGTAGTPNGSRGERDNGVSYPSGLQLRRLFDENVRGLSEGFEREIWKGAVHDPAFGETPEFKVARKHFTSFGYTSVPMSRVSFGGAVNHKLKLVSLGEMSGDRFAYFMSHETSHILSRQGNEAIAKIKANIDTGHPDFFALKERLPLFEDSLRDEVAADLAGGLDNYRNILKGPKEYDDTNIKEARAAAIGKTDKGTELYSVNKAEAGQIHQMPTLADVQQVFKGQNVSQLKDGSIVINTATDHTVVVKSVDHISPDRFALQIGHGKESLKDGEVVAGKYQDGTIELVKGAGDKWTLHHESVHFMEDIGILNKNEVGLLQRHIKNLVTDGKFETQNKKDIGGAEDRANFLADVLTKDPQKLGLLGRITTKIQDFIDKLVNAFGIRTVKGIERDVKSGEIYGKEAATTGQGIAGEQYSLSAVGKSIDAMKEKLDKTTDKVEVVKSAKDGFGLAYDGMKRAFYPSSRTEAANKVAETIIGQMGKNFHQQALLKGKLNEVVNHYRESTSVAAKTLDLMQTSTGILADGIFNKMPKEKQWDFISRIQNFKKQETPELQGIADTLSKMYDDLFRDSESVTPGVVRYRKGYFPGMWEDATAAEKFFSDRTKSMEGSKAFLKEKIFDDIQAGIEAGLKPKGTPIDMAFAKMHEVQKYVTTHSVLQEMEADKTAILVKSGEREPAGYVFVPEPYGVVTRKEKVDLAGKQQDLSKELPGTPKMESYRYAVKDDVAQVFNNYLSRSLYDNKYVGKVYEGYMNAANTLNQFQLGVGSAFHAGFTSMEAVISHFSLGVKAMARGDLAEATKLMAGAPLQVYRNPMLGDKLLRAYRGESVTGQEIPQLVKWLEMAGGRATMDSRFRTSSTDKMIEAWAKGNKISAALRSPFAMVEQMARPILEWLVPRQKFGVFAEMATEWWRQNPESNYANKEEYHQATRTAMQYVWNRVDSRLGQVVYERLFTQNVAKNIVQGLVRAPGWTGGTIIEIGGGVNDFAKVFNDIAHGRKPQMTDKMAYTISLLTITGLINGVMTKLLTGENPKDGMDLLAFRTGKKDEHGNPERFLLPTYAKDIYAYINKPGTTLLNKSHPMLSLMADIAKNKDYYGVEVRNKESNLAAQAGQTGLYAAKAFVPFWMRGAQKTHERGDTLASMLSPLVGIMPATAEFTKTNAQKLMSEILQARPKGSMTREKFETNQLKNKLETRLRNHDPETSGDIQQYLKDGKLSRKDVMSIQRAVRTPYLVNAFKPLSLKEAMRVYAIATPEEKKIFLPLLRKKTHLLRDLPEEERQDTLINLRQVISG